jgi:hypothetical protein
VYSALSQVKKRTIRKKLTWWHSQDEPVPKEYQNGSLRGQKQQIAKYLQKKDPRTLPGRVKAGVVWIRRWDHDDFEAFFKSKKRYEIALREQQKLENERGGDVDNSAG